MTNDTTEHISTPTPDSRVVSALDDPSFKDAVRTMLSAPKDKVQASMAAEKAERATKRGKRSK